MQLNVHRPLSIRHHTVNVLGNESETVRKQHVHVILHNYNKTTTRWSR